MQRPSLAPNPPGDTPIIVRCGKCDAIVPPEQVDAEAAISVCEQCGAVRFLKELEQTVPLSLGRYSFQQKGEKFRAWQTCGLGYLPFALFALLLLALMLYASLGTVPVLIAAIASVWTLWLFLEWRILRIDPEVCRLIYSPFLIPFVFKVPRRDIDKAVRESSCIPNRDVVRLYYRGGSFAVEYVRPGQDSLILGRLNHYLYTVPPADPNPQAAPVVLGGREAETAEVRPYCPACGHKVRTENLDFSRLEGKCDACGREYRFAESPLRIFPQTPPSTLEGVKVEKNDERIRIDWQSTFQTGEMITFLVVFVGIILIDYLRDYFGEVPPASWFLGRLCTFGVLALIFFVRALPESLGRWTIDFDREKFEVIYRFGFLRFRRIFPRDEIVAFSLNDGSWDEKERTVRSFGFWPFLKSNVVLVRRDKEPFRLPGITNTPQPSVSVWLMNELNGFLGSSGRVVRNE